MYWLNKEYLSREICEIAELRFRSGWCGKNRCFSISIFVIPLSLRIKICWDRNKNDSLNIVFLIKLLFINVKDVLPSSPKKQQCVISLILLYQNLPKTCLRWYEWNSCPQRTYLRQHNKDRMTVQHILTKLGQF